MSAIVIQAKDRFNKLSGTSKDDYHVDMVANLHDHIFLRVRKGNAAKANMWVAVPLDQYPHLYLKTGDRVRLKLSSKIIAPDGHQKPCAVVYEIKHIEGRLYTPPFKKIVQGQRYANATS